MAELSPEQLSLRGRMGALAAHAKHGRAAMTKAARAASPGGNDYWGRIVDPNGELSESERATRAQDAKRSYFAGLALKSAQARKVTS